MWSTCFDARVIKEEDEEKSSCSYVLKKGILHHLVESVSAVELHICKPDRVIALYVLIN